MCSIEPRKIEPKQGECFSVIDVRPENKEEKINDIHLRPKDKKPLEINNLENIDIISEIKEEKKHPNLVEVGTQKEVSKNEINTNEQLSYLYSKKKMVDEYSQNESFKPQITNSELYIINRIEKKQKEGQISPWANSIGKSESINIISTKPKTPIKKITPNTINRTESLDIIKNSKEFR